MGEDEGTDDAAAKTAESLTDKDPIQVVIVDDDHTILRLIDHLVAGFPQCESRLCRDPLEALALCRKEMPDIILTDYRMPVIDGLEFVRRLRKLPGAEDVLVCVITASEETSVRRQALDRGANDFLMKPIDKSEFVARMQNFIRLRISRRKLQDRARSLAAEVEKATAEIRYDALHDRLTDLPNRRGFLMLVDEALDRLKRDGALFGVLVFNIDRFRMVIESLGHAAGDALIVSIAKRLKELRVEGMAAGRLSGDEFALLLPNVATEAQVTEQWARIVHQTEPGHRLDIHEIFVTVSGGFAQGAPDYLQAEHMLRDASIAVQRAKAEGSGRCRLYDRAMHERAMQALRLANDLRRAIDKGDEFVLLYQPLVDLAKGSIAGFEALIRWRHPSRGLVPPSEFLDLAEQVGLIVPMGAWALREAIRQIHSWRQRFGAELDLKMSVNVSARQFSEKNFVGLVETALADGGLAGADLKLEITESTMMENPERVSGIMSDLNARQVELAVDDFGTGYSSLSYLERFPIRFIKIDRSFVNGMMERKVTLELVRLVTRLAETLGVDIVAEGVETAAQLQVLRDFGCHYAQGYFFAQPLTPAAAEALLAKRPRW